MPTPVLPLSPKLREGIEVFVYNQRAKIRNAGLTLYSSNAVHRLWLDPSGQTLRGKVRDSRSLDVAIEFSTKGVRQVTCEADCAGPCRHVLAALIAYFEGWKGLGMPAKGEADEDEDDDWDDDDDEADDEYEDGNWNAGVDKIVVPSAPLPSVPKKSLPPATPAKSRQPQFKDLSILANLLEDRFKIRLSGSEKQLTAMVDQLYQKNTPLIRADILLAIAGQINARHFYYDPPVILWPAHRTPASITEAWYYTAWALKNQRGAPADCFILRHVPWPEVQQLIAPWKRQESIAEWQGQLAALNQLPSLPPPVSPAFRLLLNSTGGQIQQQTAAGAQWTPVKISALRTIIRDALFNPYSKSKHTFDEDALRFLSAICPQSHLAHLTKPQFEPRDPQFTGALDLLLRSPHALAAASVVNSSGEPLAVRSDQPATWQLDEPGTAAALNASDPGDYTLALRQSDGSPLTGIIVLLPGQPNLAVTPQGAYPVPGPPLQGTRIVPGAIIPAAAVESEPGMAALDRLGIPLPRRVSSRIRTVPIDITVRCELLTDASTSAGTFRVEAAARSSGLFPDEYWKSGVWKIPPASNSNSHNSRDPWPNARTKAANTAQQPASPPAAAPSPDGTLTRLDRSLQTTAGEWLQLAQLSVPDAWPVDHTSMQRRLNKKALAAFPDEFLTWLHQRPQGITVELDPELAALRDQGRVSAAFHMEVEESGIDWFDLTLHLKLSDLELTQKEIDLLLKNTGSWVRLPNRGWRRLDLALTEEQERQLADLGLSPADMDSGEKQRLHTLQLAHPAAAGLLPAERAAEVQRRASELRTSVTPPLPAGITATLRPYQTDGWHFLAYLSTNRFGGILADDMGLGKTLQALTWLAWLHETGQLHQRPILVVCPKSVQDNWTSEAARFFPTLPVRQWTPANTGDLTGIDTAATSEAAAKPGSQYAKSKPAKAKTSGKQKSAAPASTAPPATPPILLVINYTQLRLHADALAAVRWSTVILDEAQYIKNPASLTAKSAYALTSTHRLALSGTPIENRLLDLWSIMAFAMPGVLSNRSQFAKNFAAKDDPLARRRLSARVRPFVLRRTKKEVAADLPDRIEEDLICALEGPQLEQYTAELKLARATLLKAKTSAQLDKLRFNILTSLLRLRQICCHPRLTGKGEPGAESAKLNALLELLEPLVEEGHKVLIFSQFVEMLQLISTQLQQREWPHLILTGNTEDRGALVRQFQESEGANLFLISLKAGGSGLNLTAASYVVLFDPWWNPAVENQAIDRTHRIGQVNKVIAYRLITRDTIEEKIRHLQKSKSALAADILGEETFAKALTLDDFQFLLNP